MTLLIFFDFLLIFQMAVFSVIHLFVHDSEKITGIARVKVGVENAYLARV